MTQLFEGAPECRELESGQFQDRFFLNKAMTTEHSRAVNLEV
jgi:hypothetical protein